MAEGGSGSLKRLKDLTASKLFLPLLLCFWLKEEHRSLNSLCLSHTLRGQQGEAVGQLIICGMWRGYKIGPDWECTEPGMVITVEIKHHQLWGFSTFHSVPLSLFPPESPFSSHSNSNDPLCHSLRFSTVPPVLRIFSTMFHRIPLLHFFLPLSTLPFILFSFFFFFCGTPPSHFIYLCFVFPVFRSGPFYTKSLGQNHFVSPSCVPRPHSFAGTNDHIRQMTLITVRLECKNTERRRPKHFLHIPSASTDSHSLCSLVVSQVTR